MKFSTISILLLIVGGLFLGWSIFEYVKQHQAFVDYFSKPSEYPVGSSVPVPDTNTFIPYLIVGIILCLAGLQYSLLKKSE